MADLARSDMSFALHGVTGPGYNRVLIRYCDDHICTLSAVMYIWVFSYCSKRFFCWLSVIESILRPILRLTFGITGVIYHTPVTRLKLEPLIHNLTWRSGRVGSVTVCHRRVKRMLLSGSLKVARRRRHSLGASFLSTLKVASLTLGQDTFFIRSLEVPLVGAWTTCHPIDVHVYNHLPHFRIQSIALKTREDFGTWAPRSGLSHSVVGFMYRFAYKQQRQVPTI